MSAVADALRRSPLLTPGDRVLVACSGGPDSLALLHALHILREEWPIDVAAAHFHHGLRGTDADADAAFVQTFCQERGIACHVGRADVAALARARKVGTETAARDARYAFLTETADRTGATKIATAHHAGDQAETVLMHILRGAGLDGLRGIPPQRDRIIRPLLSVSRADIDTYCAAYFLQPRHDATNTDTDSSMRSRVRHELLPLLEQRYNPGVRDALLRLSISATRDADFLRDQAESALAACILERSADMLTLDAERLRSLHPTQMRHVLRAAMESLRGTEEGVTFAHVETLSAAVSGAGSAGVTLPAPVPCRVVSSTDRVTLRLSPARREKLSFYAPLPVPGVVQMEGWTVQSKIDTPNSGFPAEPLTVFLDSDRLDTPTLHVRTWREGDKIAPLGMGGHTQKLSDIFVNAKVPSSLRHRLPIVADCGGLLWVAGQTLSERGRITPYTRKILCLQAHGD